MSPSESKGQGTMKPFYVLDANTAAAIIPGAFPDSPQSESNTSSDNNSNSSDSQSTCQCEECQPRCWECKQKLPVDDSKKAPRDLGIPSPTPSFSSAAEWQPACCSSDYHYHHYDHDDHHFSQHHVYSSSSSPGKYQRSTESSMRSHSSFPISNIHFSCHHRCSTDAVHHGPYSSYSHSEGTSSSSFSPRYFGSTTHSSSSSPRDNGTPFAYTPVKEKRQKPSILISFDD